MIYPITLRNKEDVIRLNEMATKEKFNLNVSNGSVVIDAKSLLALFSLIGKTVNLVTSDSTDPSQFRAFLKKFI
jgi:hypothetical protein